VAVQDAGVRAQVHHWPGGTAALTSAMCSPHPSQVVLWQLVHSTGRHMMVVSSRSFLGTIEAL